MKWKFGKWICMIFRSFRKHVFLFFFEWIIYLLSLSWNLKLHSRFAVYWPSLIHIIIAFFCIYSVNFKIANVLITKMKNFFYVFQAQPILESFYSKQQKELRLFLLELKTKLMWNKSHQIDIWLSTKTHIKTNEKWNKRDDWNRIHFTVAVSTTHYNTYTKWEKCLNCPYKSN